MNKKLFHLLCAVILFTYGSFSYAAYGASLGFGGGSQDVDTYRINLQKTWDGVCNTAVGNRFGGFWEVAFTKLSTNRVPTHTNDQIFSGSAVVRLKQNIWLPVYLDLGFGLAYAEHQEIGSRDLGSNALFEERLGLGVLLGKKQQFEIGYRFVHYSNAYLAAINQGLNLHMIIVGFWLN